MRNEFILFSIISTLLLIGVSQFVWPPMWWGFVVLAPIILLGYYDMFQKKHAIMRNFPILGRGRYLMEDLRPKMYQYFIESDTNGTPINRNRRSVVYQRAKNVLDTKPFGTQLDVYEPGYEWLNHSIAAIDSHSLEQHPRHTVGTVNCSQPYSASLLNVSAMSFGSLSKNAIMALNGGAAMGAFAHNTGEGGISPYHKKHGGDLIFQFGTGYFGVRDENGVFSDSEYEKLATATQVKMIEVKLSQGAKPGHGGILPAKKNTKEIAKIRGVEPGVAVHSPPFHTAFTNPVELLQFIGKLQRLSGGKPVGFKLCVGWKSEFLAICKAMLVTGIKPDFIAVDGGEGGTGAAPLEFSNSVGAPFRDGLAFVHDALIGFNLRDDMSLIASGKIITAFDIFKALALGADLCYSARAMMLALGCIQALECNKNNCPTGVATQDDELVSGLNVKDKKQRVMQFHKDTMEAFVELISAAGIQSADQINRYMVNRRIDNRTVLNYAEIYPYVSRGCLLEENTIPEAFDKWMALADPYSFRQRFVEVI